MATLLVIDDCAAHRGHVRTILKQAGLFQRILEAGDGIEGLSLLMRESVDVVLCDVAMPGLDGDKLLRMKAANPGGAHIPFLVLTGSVEVERRARLLEQGASDVIAKPFHPAELVARLQLHLKLKRLQDELLLKNAALANLSSADSLTGLRTRRFVDDVLNLEFLRARRYRSPLSLAMADLDHFKQVNDEFGHPAGDAVLRQVATTLQTLLRRTDLIGRYGGEEFLLLHPQSTASGATALAERIRQAVAALRVETPAGPIGVTVSLGVAEYDRQMESPEDLIAAADRALYAAKRAGRNRVVVASATAASAAHRE
jgi:diguanylate cyclase (GGDEF)-like protein